MKKYAFLDGFVAYRGFLDVACSTYLIDHSPFRVSIRICALCDLSSETDEGILLHIQRSTDCSSRRRLHPRTHTMGLVIPCGTCEFTASSDNEYVDHLNNYGHWAQCENCSETFQWLADCSEHMNYAGHWTQQYPCPTCGYIFWSIEERDRHMSTYCHDCQRQFQAPANFQAVSWLYMHTAMFVAKHTNNSHSIGMAAYIKARQSAVLTAAICSSPPVVCHTIWNITDVARLLPCALRSFSALFATAIPGIRSPKSLPSGTRVGLGSSMHPRKLLTGFGGGVISVRVGSVVKPL